MGFFPLDQQLKLGKHSWSPETIQQAVVLGIQIPSYARAAMSFEQLTKIPLSKSSMQQLVNEYGQRLGKIQDDEAAAMVSEPVGVSEGEAWRAIPEPDSAQMAVALDGCMVNVRGEGWKEVKVAAISAVETAAAEAGTAEPTTSLQRTSYRAGLWEAACFANQQWAEGCRRGLEKAQRVVCVSDGAAWIWAIVAMCYAPRCIEILDWWHATQSSGNWPSAYRVKMNSTAMRGQPNRSHCSGRVHFGRLFTRYASSVHAGSRCRTRYV